MSILGVLAEQAHPIVPTMHLQWRSPDTGTTLRLKVLNFIGWFMLPWSSSYNLFFFSLCKYQFQLLVLIFL